MAVYHFDVQSDGGPWSDDDTGTELPGPDLARDEAVRLAYCLARENPAPELSIRVRNGQPTPLLTVRVSTSIKMRA